MTEISFPDQPTRNSKIEPRSGEMRRQQHKKRRRGVRAAACLAVEDISFGFVREDHADKHGATVTVFTKYCLSIRTSCDESVK